MVDPNHTRLSIVRQCRWVSIARSSFYYEGTGETPLTLRLMRLIDEQFLETPFFRAGVSFCDPAPPNATHTRVWFLPNLFLCDCHRKYRFYSDLQVFEVTASPPPLAPSPIPQPTAITSSPEQY